ncbi:MAG: helix-hairpin-helix domain-containing protein [Rikenellaceae bacterium]|jgi:DNA uptake protein ComE-like DNA-binding protein|nr:helix-hairpin-helix domain-containing protein [Rikenellaceae bacterium]
MKNPFGFSSGERKGLLMLLPLVAMVGAAVWLSRCPRGDRNLSRLADAKLERRDGSRDDLDGFDDPGGTAGRDRDFTNDVPRGGELFVFDPNTASLRELIRLGFSKKEAAGIISYRRAGKVFRDPYDFAGCWQVSIEQFERLEKYIVIGERFRRRNGSGSADGEGGHTIAKAAAKKDSLFRFNPNTLTAGEFELLGFSAGQAGAIVSYRELIGGFRSPEAFAKCYQVGPERFARLAPYIDLPAPARREKLDVNLADSAELCTLSGVGPLTAGRIIAMRRRLGGFVSVAQLAEVAGVTEQNFERFAKEIFVSEGGITKIDINFASPGGLEHPYISAIMQRRILKYRQLKGGWSNIEDMVEEQILTREQADRLAPYLVFLPGTD